MSWFGVVSGVIVGLAFGYALQRGRFCVNTGFRDLLLIRDSTLFRAWALAVAVQMGGVSLLSGLDLLPVSVAPLWWAANLAGGLMFGVGMVIAGGCSSGTCYRVGEGMAGSLIALLGFGAGILLTARGALAPLAEQLRATVLTAGGDAPTLANLLGLRPLWVGLPIAVAVVGLLWRTPAGRSPSGGWTWRTAGLALGGIGIAAWLASAASGRHYGLSMTGPLRSWFEWALAGDNALDWGSMLIAGLIAGSFLAAWLNSELRWRVPRGQRLLQSGGGGVVMGIGAQIAGGCTIGHSLTGLSVLSLGSALTTVAILAGAWGTAYLMFVRPQHLVVQAAQLRRNP